MAQAQVASMPSAINMSTSSPSVPKDELRQIEEYGRIISFRDRVLSGKHPTIKVPSHLLAAKSGNPATQPPPSASSPSAAASPAGAATTTAAPSRSTPSPGHPTIRDSAAANRQAFQTNSVQPSVTTNFPGLGSLPVNGRSGGAASAPGGTPVKPFNSARAEIHPIFLEKSDHLVKTEIQMKRQRIERALREQLEQRRNSGQASESLPDFDLMDVLQKALVLVEQTAPPSTDATVAANNKPEDSDSFDENSFYSSQFDDSPNSAHVARIANPSEPEDVDMRESPDYEPELSTSSVSFPTYGAHTRPAVSEQGTGALHQPQQPTPTRISPSHRAVPTLPDAARRAPETQRDALPSQRMGTTASAAATVPLRHEVHTVSSQESGDASGSADSGVNTDNEQSVDDLRTRSIALARNANGFEAGGTTVVRAHDLSPLAPQPSHVSPLVTSRNPPEVAVERPTLQGTPAQVAALRHEPPAASSPESSPQVGKANDKRKSKKKNKRKADRQPADASPYIKNEPRSPSPLGALPAARPHKRLRPTQQPAEQLNYDEPACLGAPAEVGYNDRREGHDYREDAPRVVYEARDGSVRDSGAPTVVSGARQYDPDVYEIRRPPTTTQLIRHPESSGLYPVHYGPGEARLRSVSHAVIDRPYREAPIYYRDVRDEPRMSVRPAVDRERSRSPIMREAHAPTMAPPPRAQTTRIFIDEFGREYIEPPPRTSTAIRQSVAPSSRPLDNVVYGHPPPPSMPGASRMPEGYGDGVIYRRVSPPGYPAPRRVITEPEYINGDYRSYRQREYPAAQPGHPPVDEYVQGRAVPERRTVDDVPPPRDYLPRAASVRPAEPVRYEMASHYGERMGSVRPEATREYGVAVHAEARRDAVHQQFSREYSVRPDAQVIQRPYSTRPVEQASYYERPTRRDDGVTFVERPREGLEGVVYTEAPRREAYD